MKSVLISIQPKWCELIANGKKTVEVRKSRPKLETPFKCYIYCTNDRKYMLDKSESGKIYLNGNIYRDFPMGLNSKVIGEFVCDKIYQYSTNKDITGQTISDKKIQELSCMTKEELCDYEFSATARENCIYLIGLYGWHISDLVIYDKPKELSEFHQCHTCEYASCCNDTCWKPLKRPPQSWCYVESEVEDNE